MGDEKWAIDVREGIYVLAQDLHDREFLALFGESL